MRLLGLILSTIALIMVSPISAEESLGNCSFAVYPVESDEGLAEEPLIAPEDVVAIEQLEDPVTGEPVWDVEVTDEAAERVYSYSKANIGKYLATFCGERRINRPMIRAPFKGRFRISSVLPSNNSL